MSGCAEHMRITIRMQYKRALYTASIFVYGDEIEDDSALLVVEGAQPPTVVMVLSSSVTVVVVSVSVTVVS